MTFLPSLLTWALLLRTSSRGGQFVDVDVVAVVKSNREDSFVNGRQPAKKPAHAVRPHSQITTMGVPHGAVEFEPACWSPGASPLSFRRVKTLGERGCDDARGPVEIWRYPLDN